MKTITLHPRATAAILQGLLVVNSLISGTSTLQCYSSSSIMRCSPGGTVTFGLSAPASITTCSSEENVCVEAQLKLLRENEILLVNYRGCGRKDLSDGTKSTVTSDGAHFPFQSDSRCCDSDLCNGETDPKTPGDDKGSFSNSLFFKSCQHSSSDISQDQTLHPITVVSRWDSCCTNSFGNVLGTAGQTLKNGSRDHINASDTESSASYSTVPSRPELHLRGKGTYSVPGHYSATTVDPNDTDLVYDEYGAENTSVYLGTADNDLQPRLRGSSANGLILQLFPLLITTGISVLGIWW